MTEVYKFGGAAVKDAAEIKNVVNIIGNYAGEQLVVVISAMGKTTNALEGVLNSYYNEQGNAQALLEDVKRSHFMVMQELGLTDERYLAEINDAFVEIDWVIEDAVQDDYDYLYDQIVSVGELISTKIVYFYYKTQYQDACWLDVRDVIITDNTYREAKVDWKETQMRIQDKSEELFAEHSKIITQGFIASSSENFTTTLGREGSDYSAAVFSYCLDAEALTIWKDVPGILTGDPSLFENVNLVKRLDYREAIEMTYFGAKVIHPKTIKPLQNKSIPLYVKPFSDPNAEGTCITNDVHNQYDPVVVIERNQTLIHIATKDFSFVAEEHLSEIFKHLDTCRLKVNMMRNSAISFSVCVTEDPSKIDKFISLLGPEYNALRDEQLELITIRHYDESTLNNLTSDKTVIFEERLDNTVRSIVKVTPKMTFKK